MTHTRRFLVGMGWSPALRLLDRRRIESRTIEARAEDLPTWPHCPWCSEGLPAGSNYDRYPPGETPDIRECAHCGRESLISESIELGWEATALKPVADVLYEDWRGQR